jgi:hypothetical protein
VSPVVHYLTRIYNAILQPIEVSQQHLPLWVTFTKVSIAGGWLVFESLPTYYRFR